MNPDVLLSSSTFLNYLNNDLYTSLSVADELSQEFSKLLKESEPQADLEVLEEKPQCTPKASSPDTFNESDNAQFLSPVPTVSVIESSPCLLDSRISDSKNNSSPPHTTPKSPSPPLSNKDTLFSSCWSTTSPNLSYGQQMPPNRSPVTQRCQKSQREHSPSPCPSPFSFDQSIYMTLRPSATALPRYESGHVSPRSPRQGRRPSPRLPRRSGSSTLPRDYAYSSMAGERTGSDVGQQRQISAERKETDPRMFYGQRPRHRHPKTEWLRPSVQTATWRESSRDSPPPVSTKNFQDSHIHQVRPSSPMVPHGGRLSKQLESPTLAAPASLYSTLPLMTSSTPAQARWHQPVPLSVIMQLQRPPQVLSYTRHPLAMDKKGEGPSKQQPQLLHPGWKQPEACAEEGQRESEGGDGAPVPRPLSPTCLQPVPDPEDLGSKELLLLRSEIPRALKRRRSINESEPKPHALPRNQYKQFVRRLFRRKAGHHKGESGSSESNSSSDEDGQRLPADTGTPPASVQVTPQPKSLQSILKRAHRQRKGSGRRARLSPLVLLLDGALVGELDTVQMAFKEMSDPSQPNEEGITALHNAICWGHYDIVEFLVLAGANVSTPDSHGWTPLHCAATCNDLATCELLVRNGAAVMAVTEGDGATAAQKCDPFAPEFEECERFLREVEEAMGVENGRILYALWDYSAQALDELSFREGEAVTIVKKPEGAEWWWASLSGREGFVPNNYFGLFPKVQPKSRQDQNQKFG